MCPYCLSVTVRKMHIDMLLFAMLFHVCPEEIHKTLLRLGEYR